MLRRLYPLEGLPQQRQIWSWISFDVANQSFTLIINTLLFPIYFTKVVVADPDRDDLLWSLTFATSMLLTVIASPIAGAITDDRSWKKAALLVTGFGCALFTCLFGLIRPGQLGLAIALYVPANFFFSIGENFLSSFLPSLARKEQFGRVSGFSWACAYSAALVLLVVTAAVMIAADLKSETAWKPFFVFAGAWFFAFSIPTLLYLHEPPAQPAAGPKRSVWIVGFVRVAESIRHVKQFRDLTMLLIASVLYGTGMSVIIFFASILATEFGFNSTDLVIFVAVITVSGIIGTLVPTWFQDRLGHRRTTVMLLGVWIATALGFGLFSWLRDRSADPAAFPSWPLWVFGNLIGLGLGSLGSANRAFVSYLAPPSRAGEVFGLWGMVFKLAAVLTIPFAWVKDAYGTTPSLFVLAGFLLAGLVLTLLVDEKRGGAAAHEAHDTPRP